MKTRLQPRLDSGERAEDREPTRPGSSRLRGRGREHQTAQPALNAERKLQAIRTAMSCSFPTADINQMLREIGAGARSRALPDSDKDTAAVRTLLEERRVGRFISLAEGRERTERMIARKNAALAVPD